MVAAEQAVAVVPTIPRITTEEGAGGDGAVPYPGFQTMITRAAITAAADR
jgi:hypothetical protein